MVASVGNSEFYISTPKDISHSDLELLVKAHAPLNVSGLRTGKAPLSSFNYTQAFADKMATLTRSVDNVLLYISNNFELFSKYLNYPEKLNNFLFSTPAYGRNIPFVRLDMFPTNNGMKIVEINTESPGGNEESAFLEDYYATFFMGQNDPLHHAKERMKNSISTVINSYVDQMVHKNLDAVAVPFIVLLEDKEDIRRIQGEFNSFIRGAKALGYDVPVVSPDQIDFKNNYARLNGKRIDAIYRRFMLHNVESVHSDGYAFAQRLNESNTAIVNPFASKRTSSKQLLALISDTNYSFLFPENLKDDLVLIRNYLPVTYSLKNEDLLPDDVSRLRVKENKADYVIKKANSDSSVGVYIGSDIDVNLWRALVDEHYNSDAVLQERIQLPSAPISYIDSDKMVTKPLIYNVNPYSMGGEFKGFYVRASEDNLTSFKVGLDATVLPTYKIN